MILTVFFVDTPDMQMNFLRQGFRKLLSDKQTDRQTDRQIRPKLYTTPLRGWSKLGNNHKKVKHNLPTHSQAIIVLVSK